MGTRRCIPFGIAAGVFLGMFAARERDAIAQARFGDRGQLAITAENVFALSSERFGQTLPDGDHSVTSNRFGFLYSQGTPTSRGPQVGGHYFVIPSLSVGATLGYEARGGSRTDPTPRGVVTQNTDDFSTFVFVPKVGYALMLSNVIGFWFRGGPGFFRVGRTDGINTVNKSSDTYWILSLDALFVWSPVPHLGFYAGPQADISFAGTHSDTNNMGLEVSNSATYRNLGIGLGILGYIDL